MAIYCLRCHLPDGRRSIYGQPAADGRRVERNARGRYVHSHVRNSGSGNAIPNTLPTQIPVYQPPARDLRRQRNDHLQLADIMGTLDTTAVCHLIRLLLHETDGNIRDNVKHSVVDDSETGLPHILPFTVHYSIVRYESVEFYGKAAHLLFRDMGGYAGVHHRPAVARADILHDMH